jgi:uncharacterized membrane protein YphA (DoxX/SURF4 family)
MFNKIINFVFESSFNYTMNISTKLDRLHSAAKANKWLYYFTVFNRIALALGFLPSGFVKIMGERFTNLSVNHPMGNYLEAMHHTGYYYTFIGIAQMTAAVLLLIPRTALLGALLYFPIIVNICILSLAVRFEGSLLTSPLMVLSCLYLLCWDYDKLRFIFPFYNPTNPNGIPVNKAVNKNFPIKFFAGVAGAVVMVVFVITHVYDIMPRNTLKDCMRQCKSKNADACNVFCDCIHTKGQPLNKSLEAYHQALNKSVQAK